MKIAITGTNKSGKTTLATNMTYAWPNFKLIKCEKDFSKETFPIISKFDWHTDKILEAQNSGDVVFDDCLINILAEILIENENGNISDEQVKKCILIFRQSCRFYDLVFNLPLSKETPIKLNDFTKEDLEKREQLDMQLQALWWDWREERPTFFVYDDRPPIIKLFGDEDLMISTIARDFINEEGKPKTNSDEDLQQQMLESVEEYAAYQSLLGGNDKYEKVLRDLKFNK